MKIDWRKILIVSGLALFMAVPELFARASWESVRGERLTEYKQVLRTSEIEVRVDRSCIYVSTTRPVQVKVFSILGTPVSQENLPAGVSRLRLGTHGIFIVKIADLTCKVAL